MATSRHGTRSSGGKQLLELVDHEDQARRCESHGIGWRSWIRAVASSTSHCMLDQH